MSRGSSALENVREYLASLPPSPEGDRVLSLLDAVAEELDGIEGESEEEYANAERWAGQLRAAGLEVPE